MSTTRRLRTAKVQVVSAALASVLLLGGCAAGTHPGAAASVGGEEISVGDVDKSTEAIQTAIGGGQVTPTVVLGLLVDNVLAGQVQEQRSITVTEAEIDQASKVVFDPQVYEKFVADPVTKDFLRNSARALVARIKLAGGSGSIKDPQAPAQNTAGTKLVEEAAKNIDVDVAPRYGKWDGSKVSNGEQGEDTGSLSVLSDQTKAAKKPPAGQQQQEQPPAEQPPAEQPPVEQPQG
ncbi:hypothetical protein [Kribbella sp. CA-293567]|uniref:hypothetical protein n=1 Tax=Kribbella sp. CA-293567 TaxID=3002436 RepID=UPI0022DDE512|nr:hypothetical protein [Kribbella sp. CA-293567]WBQ06802.1 hypothetical protein OX958_08400 [Kribbella sp. CA-293567]